MKDVVTIKWTPRNNHIDIETILGDKSIQITKYIYKEVDRLILENMPKDILEDLHLKVTNEIQRRITDGNW